MVLDLVRSYERMVVLKKEVRSASEIGGEDENSTLKIKRVEKACSVEQIFLELFECESWIEHFLDLFSTILNDCIDGRIFSSDM